MAWLNDRYQACPAIILTIVVPTYNERANVVPLVEAISATMGSAQWELIFVDDDSPDGTAAEVAALARRGAPVRCIRRIGRHGLASAVVEGVLSANSDIVAVIDGDLQHDEMLLPRMLEILTSTDTDLVVGSRYISAGGVDHWDARRRWMSRLATWCSRAVIGSEISDPMSGFFMTRRSVFDASIYDLSQQGYKILLDVLSSSRTRLRVVELPYIFRDRLSGESKIDAMIVIEYAFLLVEKLSRGLVPARFVLFSIIGTLGLVVHLSVLQTLKSAGWEFIHAQVAATLVAMTFNFGLNNSVTYRTERLQAWRFLTGYMLFCLVCSIGAVANVSVANLMMTQVHSWPLAGIAGALMSSVFNFGVATKLVWSRRRRPRQPSVAGAFPAWDVASPEHGGTGLSPPASNPITS